MPTLPKWLANGMERVFDRMVYPVVVQDIHHWHPQLKQVRFVGDLSTMDYVPGQVIGARVDEHHFRHYTPALIDLSKGHCDIIFYLHGKGPGSHWAEQLQLDATAKLMGPGGKMQFRPAATHHFVYGDASALGLSLALQKAALEAQQEFLCFSELDPAQLNWPSLIGLEAEVVPIAPEQPGSSTVQNLSTLPPSFWEHWQQGHFYLAGQRASLKTMRQFLQQKGIHRHQITTFPYWAEGKRGL